MNSNVSKCLVTFLNVRALSQQWEALAVTLSAVSDLGLDFKYGLPSSFLVESQVPMNTYLFRAKFDKATFSTRRKSELKQKGVLVIFLQMQCQEKRKLLSSWGLRGEKLCFLPQEIVRARKLGPNHPWTRDKKIIVLWPGKKWALAASTF